MSSRAYYNENDPAAVHVLHHLIADGVIAPGDVDSRSIKEVQPNDLEGYTQHHFFAGGGLWSVALRSAGWPDNRPVWTASTPCQPHSAAASDRKRGFDDDRDLWPQILRLIRLANPDVFFGEQVDDSAAWLDRMHADLEIAGYAVGTIDLPACAIDAPHVRMRSYTVAHSDCARRREQGWPVAVAPQQLSIECSSGRTSLHDHITTGELGRNRRSESGVCILSDDIPGRVDLWRIGGNAIVPQAAKEVITAYIDVYGLPARES